MSFGLEVVFGGMSFIHMVMAFACGIFGAAAGGLPCFAIIGVLVSIGSGVALATGGDMAYLFNVAFGYGFGPIAFGGGVAAASYAAMKGYMENGKDIVTPLISLDKPDVLLVGGVFGCLTAGIMYLFLNVIPFTIGGAFWTDGLAVALFPVLIIIRLLFGKTGVFGKVAEGESRFGNSEVAMTDTAEPQAPKVWLPWQTKPVDLLLMGFAAGIGAAGLALIFPNGGVFMGFGIALMFLFLLIMGLQVPVFHHICIIAALAATYSGSVIWGAIFGILSAFTAEFMSKVFLVHADTYIDPPVCAILTLTTLVLVFDTLGIFGMVVLP